MATNLHTFMDIFGSVFEAEGEPVTLEKIIIPMIQRDYAQGRTDAKATLVRENLIENIHQIFNSL